MKGPKDNEEWFITEHQFPDQLSMNLFLRILESYHIPYTIESILWMSEEAKARVEEVYKELKGAGGEA